jgi:predicted nucleic acid-binding protein
MTRAVADTSVLIAREGGRELGELPDELAISVITAAELELGVLRARDTATRARRLATLTRTRASMTLLGIDGEVGSCFARLAAAEREAGRKVRLHDAWIAATAMRHGAAVLTQDADFTRFADVTVLRV